jgi:hypothetical protein
MAEALPTPSTPPLFFAEPLNQFIENLSPIAQSNQRWQRKSASYKVIEYKQIKKAVDVSAIRPP